MVDRKDHSAERGRAPMKAIDRLLNRLAQVRQIGNDRWIARCPAHDDRKPSFSLKQTKDRVLLKCWAGCATHAVVAAVGLTLADLYDDRSGKPDPSTIRSGLAAQGL